MRGLDFDGDGEPERRPLFPHAVGADVAAHQLDQLARDGQPEPGAAVFARHGAVGLLEGFEDARQRGGGNADAAVDHGEAQQHPAAAVAGAADRQVDHAVIGELDGVADQIDEHLPQPPRIAAQQHRHVRIELPGQFEPLFRGAHGVEVGEVLKQRQEVEIDHLDGQLPGLDLRVVENVVDDRQQRIGAGADDAGVFALLGVERRVEQQFGHADDAVHGRADLVRHHGEKFALGAVGPLGMVARLDQFALDGDPRRNVVEAEDAADDLVVQVLRPRLALEHAPVGQFEHVEALLVGFAGDVLEAVAIGLRIAQLAGDAVEEQVVVAAQQQVLGQMPHFGEAVVHADDAVAGVDDEDAVPGRLQRGAQLRRHLGEVGGGLLFAPHVARAQHQPFVAVGRDAPDGARHRQQAAVGAAVEAFGVVELAGAAVLDVLPEEDVGEGAFDLGDLLVHQLVVAVAETAAGDAVGGANGEGARVDEQQHLVGMIEQQLVEAGIAGHGRCRMRAVSSAPTCRRRRRSSS